MIELFAEIPVEVKTQHEQIIDLALKTLDVNQLDLFFSNYINSTVNQDEKEFIAFLLQLKMEQLSNENNNDKR